VLPHQGGTVAWVVFHTETWVLKKTTSIRVPIRDMVERAVAQTRMYGPDSVEWQPHPDAGSHQQLRVGVTGKTTSQAASHLAGAQEGSRRRVELCVRPAPGWRIPH
jgi:hypothetical protein